MLYTTQQTTDGEPKTIFRATHYTGSITYLNCINN